MYNGTNNSKELELWDNRWIDLSVGHQQSIAVFILLWWYNNMKFLLGLILLPASLIYGFQTTPFRPFYWSRMPTASSSIFHHRGPLGTPHAHMVSPQMRTPPSHIPMENYRTPQFLMPSIKPSSNSMSYHPYSFHRMIVSESFLRNMYFDFGPNSLIHWKQISVKTNIERFYLLDGDLPSNKYNWYGPLV